MLKTIKEISDSFGKLETAFINFQKGENYRNNSDIVINELSFSNFIADVSFLIQQFRYLIKSHNVFMVISTYNERISFIKEFSILYTDIIVYSVRTRTKK